MNSQLTKLAFIATLLMIQGKCDSDVGFPEREHLDIERNNTRIPLFIPGRCPENQLLYPGNQKNDWICDCRPGYLYYAPLDGCYEAYRQGPCPSNQYLTLAQGDFNPTCTTNQCREDGVAPYAGACYPMYKEGGPCRLEAGGGIFGVNSTTLQLECLKGTDRFSISLAAGLRCPPGSRRDRNNQCTTHSGSSSN